MNECKSSQGVDNGLLGILEEVKMYEADTALTAQSFCPTTSIAMQLGNLLQKIYYLANQAEIPDFDDQLFPLLQANLDFDAAWLGRSTITDQEPIIHCNILYQLEQEYVETWRLIKDQDILVPHALSHAGVPFTINTHSTPIHPNFQSFLHQHQISQVLCITDIDLELNTCTHLSLYRQSPNPSFSGNELELISALMPNLSQALVINRSNKINQVQEGSDAKTGVAIFSQDRVLQFASPELLPHFLNEWAHWDEINLPQAITQLPNDGEHLTFFGKQITISMEGIRDLVVLSVRHKSSKDRLTPREHSIAILSSQGKTYKEVAKTLAISPATVRHHLRNVYIKLGIQNKGAIAWALDQDQAC